MDIRFESLGITQHEYERNREILKKEQLATLLEPLDPNRNKKSDFEKEELANAKSKWVAYMHANNCSKRCGKVNAN